MKHADQTAKPDQGYCKCRNHGPCFGEDKGNGYCHFCYHSLLCLQAMVTDLSEAKAEAEAEADESQALIRSLKEIVNADV